MVARLRPLHQLEEQQRRATDFRRVPSGDQVTGADPYQLRALPNDARLVGILRGTAEVVLLDPELAVVARAPAPRSPTGLAVNQRGEIFVGGELSPEIARYRATAGALLRTGTIRLDGAGRTVRDLASGPDDLLYAVDQSQGRLLTLHVGATAPDGQIAADRQETPIGRGPIRVARIGPLLVIDCLLDHALVIRRVDGQGRPAGGGGRIQHDGPIWSFDGLIAGGELLLATGGVEDHPLDRTGGSFGYIDSFLTLYRVPLDGALGAIRLGQINLSALGVVTPKVIALSTAAGGGLRALVTGYASSLLATLVWADPLGAARAATAATVATATVQPLAPGTTSLVQRPDGGLLFADPLLDAWLVSTPAGTAIRALPGGAGARRPLARLGEALFFTTLMAPWNHADGPLSRFTCETCHFEGYVDGRTHNTGRGEVRATTKPLRGLFNNRPYFSRALDPDLATMVNNEFRVAGANSGHDPWFPVRTADFPWLPALGVKERRLPPLTLRTALMSFLIDFTHLPNPAAPVGARWNDQQRAGAALFREHCESCHQARLVGDDPASRVPFADWEGLVMSASGPIVWGLAEYRQTGIVPYVHPEGARVPSLRRLIKKFPYFTNGSGRDLTEVITRARFGGGAFYHDDAPADPALHGLDAAAAGGLRAFLDLL